MEGLRSGGDQIHFCWKRGRAFVFERESDVSRILIWKELSFHLKILKEQNFN